MKNETISQDDGSQAEAEANASAFAEDMAELISREAQPELPVFLSWRALWRMGLTVLLVVMVSVYWKSVVNGVGFVLAAIWPVILALIISYVAGIPLAFFERQYARLFKGPRATSLRRPLCMLVSVLIVLVIVVLVLFVAVPEFAVAVTVVLALIPNYLRQLQAWLDTMPFAANVYSFIPGGLTGVAEMVEKTDIGEVLMSLFTGAGTVNISPDGMIAAASSVVTSVVNTFIAFLLAFSFLMEQETLQRQIRHVMVVTLGARRYRSVSHVLHVADECFHGYFVGTFLGAVVQGVGSGLLLWLAGNPFAMSVGVLVGISALIPAVGPVIGMVLGGFLSFAVSIPSMLIALVVIFVMQQLWASVLYPMFVDRSLGLPGMWILVAIVVGGVGGLVGMAISVPLAAIIYRLAHSAIDRYEAKHGLMANPEDGRPLQGGPAPEEDLPLPDKPASA